MIRRSGYDALADAVEANPVASETLDDPLKAGAVRWLSASGGLSPTCSSACWRTMSSPSATWRIGLEYRILPQANTEGLAIHVLSDVAGQNVELLAFDCFINGPHYHYGPRNQDIRIYWDTTTSGETLRWTPGPVLRRKHGRR